ncbi:PARP-domain-containing protein [Xylariaceae sp. FL0255]|nr:PARP-domain-containing protein [Xylariaceae sp. FL0255]
MPAKKRTRSNNARSAKKQKTTKGAKSSQPTIPIDEGFNEGGDVHVHIDDDETVWDASLNLSNVSSNNNKFYMLQLLVDDEQDKYYAHTRWGRVGETGQVKAMGFGDLDAAKEEYDKKFKSKTGLQWENRTDEPKNKKYTFVERSYDEGGDAKNESDEGYGSSGSVKSELDISTQRLMELIFNENHFNSVLEEIGYNKDKLPLGKLGKASLQKGFEQLKELSSLIKHPSLAQNKYNNDDILRREVAMLDTLTDMEVANAIMNASSSSSSNKSREAVHKLDGHFRDLGLKELAPLDHKSGEYSEIQKYLLDSSAEQHGLKYRLQDVFRVERPGEHERFEKSTKTVKDSKRMLLWHGSRTTNYGGILSQGLRIAPPEAPVNGYAFGKGVYLADLSSKSANYCVTSRSGGVGLLLLVEAELSNPMYEISSGDCGAAEEAKKHNCIATKGIGRVGPKKWKDAACVHENLKGVMMPDGKPVDSTDGNSGYLMFNEYISYNVEHLKIRYLLKVGM